MILICFVAGLILTVVYSSFWYLIGCILLGFSVEVIIEWWITGSLSEAFDNVINGIPYDEEEEDQ